MNKNILYAFTHDNLGDDLFIKLICERYPNEDFHIGLSKENANESLKALKNLKFDETLIKIDKFLKYESILSNHLKININVVNKLYEKYLKQFKSSIYIVGSAFMQRKAGSDYSNLILLDKRVSCSSNFFLINANFGPCFDELFIDKTRNILKKMTSATFRDNYSYNLFKDINSVSYAPDIVLSINSNSTEAKDQVLISVMDLGDKYKNTVINICNKIVSENINVKLVTFCKSQNDDVIAKDIINTCNDSKISLLEYTGNIEEILNEFSISKAVIATRFHSLIIPLAFNKPVIPFIYSKKTKEVLNDINYTETYLELDKLDEVDTDSLVEELLSKKHCDIDDYKQESINQFKKLDEFMRKGTSL